MKNRAIIVLLIWCLFVGIVLPYRVRAEALVDPLTASMVGAASYALFSEWGIATTFSAGTPGYSQGFMNNAIEDYVNSSGGSITDLFGSEAIRLSAGKLLVAQQLYDGIVNFGNWIIDTYNIDNVKQLIGYDDKIAEPVANTEAQGTDYAYGTTAYVLQEQVGSDTQLYWIAHMIDIYGVETTIQGPKVNSYPYYVSTTTTVNKVSNPWTVYYTFNFRNETTGRRSITIHGACATFTSETSMKLSQDYVEPTVLNPGEHWEGQIDGWTGPDTNIEDLMNDIFTDAADNNLSVEGEVIPVPPGPVPTWTPVDDVIDGINQTGEILDGIGNDIGNISGHLDDIGDQIDDVTGALEGVQEGIQTQTGVISGALDQAAQDVVDAIGEQTATLDETLTETAEGVQEIAEALQPGEIEPKQFDLRRLFPFCIPFDIHNLLQKFNATPVAPHVQLPFVIQSLGFSYTFDLDFSAFDPVAQAMRTVEFIVFAIGLAWATSKVIKW